MSERTEESAAGGGRDRERGGPGQGRNRGARSGRQDVVLFPWTELSLDDAVRVICCVDDTDDLSGDTSTGYVAEQIAQAAVEMGGQVSLGITRHQLLLAEGVHYTSHNSAMCLAAYVPKNRAADMEHVAVDAIARFSAPTSDPGLCLAVLGGADGSASVPSAFDGQAASLLQFGRRAQSVVCTKEEAYALAASIPWVLLSEHGGTGEGVIGALAGCGLRLGGSDGRFRGKWDLEGIACELGVPTNPASCLGVGEAGTCEPIVEADDAAAGAQGSGMRVARAVDFCEALGLRARGNVSVVNAQGAALPPDMPLLLARGAKPIFHRGALTFVADIRDGVALPAEKVDLGSIGNGGWDRACGRFKPDNDAEECDPAMERTCRNCLYRRWTERGFACVTEDSCA